MTQLLKGIRKLDGQRRSALYISFEILEQARDGIGLTKLVFHRNLNFTIVRDHLDRLENAGLIKRSLGIIKTTPLGLEVLRYVKEIDILLKTRAYTLWIP